MMMVDDGERGDSGRILAGRQAHGTILLVQYNVVREIASYVYVI